MLQPWKQHADTPRHPAPTWAREDWWSLLFLSHPPHPSQRLLSKSPISPALSTFLFTLDCAQLHRSFACSRQWYDRSLCPPIYDLQDDAISSLPLTLAPNSQQQILALSLIYLPITWSVFASDGALWLRRFGAMLYDLPELITSLLLHGRDYNLQLRIMQMPTRYFLSSLSRA